MRILCLFWLATLAWGQPAVINPSFDEAGEGGVPRGWTADRLQVRRIEAGCKSAACVELAARPEAGEGAGILAQTFNAASLKGRVVTVSLSMRALDGIKGALQAKVKNQAGEEIYSANTLLGGVPAEDQWTDLNLAVPVTSDAMTITLQVLAYRGRIHVDSLSIFGTAISVPQFPSSSEPPSGMNRTALNNLVAFARLYGVIRHFHPSDQAAEADWNALAIEGVRTLDYATYPESLARRFNLLFERVAPGVRAYVGAEPALDDALQPNDKREVIRWHHKGYGQTGPSTYRSERKTSPAHPLEMYTIDLGRGLKARVPLELYRDSSGTLPRPREQGPKLQVLSVEDFSGNDRATRLADVIIAWNIFKYFYPYFDVVDVDWDDVLVRTLQRAALDRDADAFAWTLREMVAQLRDGHGGVNFAPNVKQGRLPLAALWVEDKLVLMSAGAGVKVRRGDEIVSIGGKPAKLLVEDYERFVSSATPQWRRRSAAVGVLVGNLGETVDVAIRPFGSSNTEVVTLEYGQVAMPAGDLRPTELVKEIQPGIWYADLTRMTDSDWAAAIPKLENAGGIVFDMRGYPRLGPGWLTHLSTEPLRSAQWHVPFVDGPGRMRFERGGEWLLPPQQPYLAAKKVFLTNGGAISYAESTMGIIEAYKLGEIVGETTAGTNGNINPFVLPGKYTVWWTGMKVLKHDGSRHHGVGIAPTIPWGRTQAGVAAGVDEVLERALKLLK